jgi:hypothetical protein
MITINASRKHSARCSSIMQNTASLAEGCGQCHHMHNDKMNASCKECHAIVLQRFKSSVKQQFLPCSGCHTRVCRRHSGNAGS